MIQQLTLNQWERVEMNDLKMSIKKIAFRCIRYVGRGFFRKRVWLVSDRESSAGDNGEAFFKYLQGKKVDSIFAISKHSKDYERIRKIGNVVNYDSLYFKFLLCVSECYCSSQLIHMETHVETPQIFLQHGIITDNLSNMLTPYWHKNFYMVCSSPIEKRIICEDGEKDHLLMTGLSRFDYLKNNPKKKVVLAFTWRPALNELKTEEKVNTEYFITLCRLMTDQKINELLSANGYELYIKLHPEMSELKGNLPKTTHCKVYEGSYNKLYEEACLMITDYSSAIYDFVYLKKPIIYYQFDEKNFYDGNPFKAKSSFSYDNEGFGPVARTYDELLTAIKEMIATGCEMKDIYLERADHFFAYNDRNNCERLYYMIEEIV